MKSGITFPLYGAYHLPMGLRKGIKWNNRYMHTPVIIATGNVQFFSSRMKAFIAMLFYCVQNYKKNRRQVLYTYLSPIIICLYSYVRVYYFLLSCCSKALFCWSIAFIFSRTICASSFSRCTLRFISSTRLFPFLLEIFRKPRLFS